MHLDLLFRQTFAGQASEASLLQEATTAYKASLDVFTKEQDPQRWVRAENGLASVLALQGFMSSGEEARHRLTEAAAAYTAVLEVNPKERGPLIGLGTLLHDYLGEFDRAYETMKQLEAVQPSDGNQLNLAEAALTAGKFSECIAITTSLDETQLKENYALVRATLLFACQWGEGDHASAIKTASLLEQLTNGLTNHGWTTKGDRVYFESAAEFQIGRSQWIKLFQALQDGERADFGEALHFLQTAGR